MNLRILCQTSLLAVSLGLLCNCSNDIASARVPDAEDVSDSLVAAPGLIEPESEEFKVGAEVNGKIRSIPIEEGGHVQRGQIIATLEDSEYQARLQSAEAEVRQRESELQRLIAGARAEERRLAGFQLEETDVTLRNAEMEFERRQQLYETGDVSREELERAAREYRVAAARNDQAIENHALVNAEARPDDIAKARAAIGVANGRVVEARALLDKTVIRSPIAGIVLRKHLKTGESVIPSPAAPIVTLGDTESLRVRVDVDEADIGKIHVGQRAYVSAQAYGESRFGGRVVRISEMLGKKNIRTEEPTERIDTKILETLIELDDNYKLPPGLRVNAFIIVND